MRACLAGSVLVLAACASGGAGTAATARPETQTVSSPGLSGRLTIAPSSGPSTTSVAAPVDQVWRVLPAAFDSAAVPVATLDHQRRLIGNEGVKVRQRLGRVPLSRYLDCGQTQIGPNADSYEVVLTVLVQLAPGPNGTTSFATTVEASARPITFAQAYSRCTSRGTLETRLLDAVKAQLPK